MKKHILFGTLALLAGSLLAADAAPKDDVTAAAKKLADKDNYAWKRTTEYAGRSRAGGRPSEGKVEKDGYLWLSMTLRTPRRSPDTSIAMSDNTIEAIKKGEKGAIKTADGWQSFSEATRGGLGPASIGARLVQIFKAPAAEAEDLADKVKDFTKDDDVYSGELTEEGAKLQIISGTGRGRGGPNAPEISGAKGSVKFWVKDGVLAKYEIKAQGKVSFRGNEIEDDRTITVEIKDVGSTKVQVPEDAKERMF
jgi:hypothetical protein